MEYKVYLTNKNVPWSAPNHMYGKCYMAESEAVKKTFVEDYLLASQNIEILFAKINTSRIIRSSYLSASFTISNGDKFKTGALMYGDYTDIDFLSKNYLISSFNGKYEYWFINSVSQSGGVFKYNCSLDLFFKSWEEWNNILDGSCQSLIRCAHIDRWKTSDDGTKMVPIIDFNSDLAFAEDIKLGEASYWPSNIELDPYFIVNVTTGHPIPPTPYVDSIRQGLSIGFVATNSIKQVEPSAEFVHNSWNMDINPYVDWWNRVLGYVPVLFSGLPSTSNSPLTDLSGVVFDNVAEAQVKLETSIWEGSGYPIPFPTNTTNSLETFKIGTPYITLAQDISQYYVVDYYDEYLWGMHSAEITYVGNDGDFINRGCVVSLQSDENYDYDGKWGQVKYSTTKTDLGLEFDNNPKNPYSYKNEVKMVYDPFTKFRLMGLQNKSADFLLQYMDIVNDEDNIDFIFDIYLSFSLDGFYAKYVPYNTDNKRFYSHSTDEKIESVNAYLYGIGLEYEAQLEFSTVINTDQQNMLVSRNQRRQAISYAKQVEHTSMANNIISTASGAASGITSIGSSIMHMNPFGAVQGAINTATSVAKGVNNGIAITNQFNNVVNKQAAQQADWRNTPNKVNCSSQNIISDLNYGGVYPYLFKLSLQKPTKELVLNKFKMKGYDLNILRNVKDYMKSRYWRNYIEADFVLTALGNSELNEETKSIISQNFTQGIEFNHIRYDGEKIVFRKLNDYNVNNVEVKYAEIS